MTTSSTATRSRSRREINRFGIAVVGLFAIVSYAVARHTHEIGVRVALGAGPAVVGRPILDNGIRLVIAAAASASSACTLRRER